MITLPSDFLENKDSWTVFIGNKKENYMSKCYKDLLLFWAEAIKQYNYKETNFSFFFLWTRFIK